MADLPNIGNDTLVPILLIGFNVYVQSSNCYG